MGNRAVVVSHDTTKENADKKIGIYLHWHGSPEDIEHVLNIAKDKIRSVDDDPQYFWARFCQIFANEIDGNSGQGSLSIGIGIVSQLDTHNFDNGVYYINNDFIITKQTDGKEFEEEDNDK